MRAIPIDNQEEIDNCRELLDIDETHIKHENQSATLYKIKHGQQLVGYMMLTQINRNLAKLYLYIPQGSYERFAYLSTFHVLKYAFGVKKLKYVVMLVSTYNNNSLIEIMDRGPFGFVRTAQLEDTIHYELSSENFYINY